MDKSNDSTGIKIQFIKREINPRSLTTEWFFIANVCDDENRNIFAMSVT